MDPIIPLVALDDQPGHAAQVMSGERSFRDRHPLPRRLRREQGFVEAARRQDRIRRLLWLAAGAGLLWLILL